MALNRIRTVTVVGAGTMGEGIAQGFAQAGLAVRLVDSNVETLESCRARINDNLKLMKEYRLLKEPLSKTLARIAPFLIGDLDAALKGTDYVVETIPEILEVKKKLFARLDRLPRRIILASNTSSIPITEIARDMETPERVDRRPLLQSRPSVALGRDPLRRTDGRRGRRSRVTAHAAHREKPDPHQKSRTGLRHQPDYGGDDARDLPPPGRGGRDRRGDRHRREKQHGP